MSSFAESDEALARRLQAEELVALGLDPAHVAAALQAPSTAPSASFPSSSPSAYSYPGRSSPLPSPSSSPSFRPRVPRDDPMDGVHPHSQSSSHLPLLSEPSTTVRRNAFSNLSEAQTPSHSKRVLCLYAAYALAEVVTSAILLSLYWSSSCNAPLNLWVTLHSARWALFLPLAVKQRLRGPVPGQSGGSARDAVLKRWGKYDNISHIAHISHTPLPPLVGVELNPGLPREAPSSPP